MNFFYNFSSPLRAIFVGNVLLLLCSLFYLIWWVVSFRPDSSGMSANGGFYITVAIFAGIAAIASMAYGISALAPDSHALPIKVILTGIGVLFLVVLAMSILVFHRIVTSELILIHLWTAVELSAVTVLYGTGRFGPGRAVTSAILIGFATIVGLICYMLYYRLSGAASYWNGMIPLVIDGFTSLVIAVLVAVR